jgi:hypothetical protein
MTEGIKKPLRALFRTAMQFYPQEYGKYSILMRLYFPFLAPVPPSKEVVRVKRWNPNGVGTKRVCAVHNSISLARLSLQRSRC